MRELPLVQRLADAFGLGVINAGDAHGGESPLAGGLLPVEFPVAVDGVAGGELGVDIADERDGDFVAITDGLEMPATCRVEAGMLNRQLGGGFGFGFAGRVPGAGNVIERELGIGER